MNEIVKTARSYIGTPFHHQGRVKGAGVDCIGLIICVARELNIRSKSTPDVQDLQGYARSPDGRTMLQMLGEHIYPITREEMQPGDVVCIAFAKHPQHVGILGDYRHGGLSIIHAAMPPGEVIETRLMFGPIMQFRAAYRFPEAA